MRLHRNVSNGELHKAFALFTEHLNCVSYEDIPLRTVDRAKDIVIDIVGCLIGGSTDSSSLQLCRLADSWGGRNESTLPGNCRKVSAHHAAFANAALARAYDFGVGGSSALGLEKPPVHISETLVPVALAMGEKTCADGKAFLTALITGEDFAGRLAASLHFTLPLDCRGTVNTLGAAVVAGKLLGLTAKQFEHALFLAAHQVGGLKQGMQFNLGQGFSAMLGIMAAELAAQGFLGVSDPIAEGKILLQTFSSGFDREIFFKNLGEEFHTSVSFKRYPCCRATHSTIECMLDLLEQGVSAENTDSFTVHVSPWTCAHLVGRPFMLRGNPRADALFSLQYAAANVLLRGSPQLEHYTDPFILDPDLLALTHRIHLTSEGWPLHKGDPKLSAFVEARMTNGRLVQAYCNFPRGHELIGSPLSAEEKKEKFLSNLSFAGRLRPKKAEEFYGILQQLDSLESLCDVIVLLHA